MQNLTLIYTLNISGGLAVLKGVLLGFLINNTIITDPDLPQKVPQTATDPHAATD
jgi:hypothetical protein